jgi:hypothetical protein
MKNHRSFREVKKYDEDCANNDAADPELEKFMSYLTSTTDKEMLHNRGKITQLRRVFMMKHQ